MAINVYIDGDKIARKPQGPQPEPKFSLGIGLWSRQELGVEFIDDKGRRCSIEISARDLDALARLLKDHRPTLPEVTEADLIEAVKKLEER